MAPKKEEREIEEAESENPTEPCRDVESRRMFFLSSPDTDNAEIIPDNEKTLHRAPCNIGPCRSMPEAAQEENNDRVEDCPQFSLFAASERNINVSDKKAGERHVPPLPQFFDGTCTVRGIEVDGKNDIEHSAESHRHIGIAAEIEINFECISQDHENGRRRVQTESLRKAVIDNEREHIGEQDFFAQTENEQDNAL